MWLVGLAACVGDEARVDRPFPPTTAPQDTGIAPVADPCNGVDDDGDGQVDEDVDLLWYEDADLDGLGKDAPTLLACAPGDGWATAAGDCDDADPELTGPVADPRFVDVSEERGLTATGPSWNGADPCLYDAQAGGAAVGDVDQDGDLDLFLPRMYLEDALLLNDGTGRFAPAPGWVGDFDGSNGALFVDVDGDRDLDLFVTRLGASKALLYVNDGSGAFTEEATARGADLDPGAACSIQFGVSAADVDGDEDLDLFVAGWQEQLLLGLTERTVLLANDGAGHFADGTVAAGIDALWDRAPFGGLFADRDDDADPDLHVIADWAGSGLFLNTGGAFAETFDHGAFTDENGMGGDLGDIDGDGDLDWFVTAIWDDSYGPCGDGWGCSGNRLYADQGDGTFADATDLAGVREGQWSWGAAFFDQDLDGALDLAFVGGFPVVGFWTEPGRFYRNRGDGTFEDRTCASGFVERGQGRSVVPLDMDRDGDQDLLVVTLGEPPTLWEARGAEGRGWLAVELDQPGPNRFGIGATVTVVEPGGREQVRLLHANAAYVAGRPPEVHFGLGDHTGPVDEVHVRWPDGDLDLYPTVGPGLVRLTRQ